MEDLSLHILDVAENSVRIGAGTITIRVLEDPGLERLTVEIEDDGPGMDRETIGRVLDPFYTTKKDARTGLGLPLLAQSAQETGGTVDIRSDPGRGTLVKAVFVTTHPDMRPMGDMAGTLRSLIAGNPGIRIICDYHAEGTDLYFDSASVNSKDQGKGT